MTNILQLDNQAIASNPLHSVWVNASAGTGKTKILTDRVLRLLLDGNHPSKILCITFTKAAASEMSNRINHELASWSIVDDEILIEKITNLTGKCPDQPLLMLARKLFTLVLDCLDGVKIQTIHSYCQSILKRFPIEADISNNYKIIDDNSAKEFLQEAKLHLLSQEELKNTISYLSSQLHESSFDELIIEIISNKSAISEILAKYDFLIEPIIDELANRFEISSNLTKESVEQSFKSYVIDNRGDFASLLTSLSPAKAKELNEFMMGDFQNLDILTNIFLTKEGEPRKLVTKAMVAKFPSAEQLINKWQNKLLFLYEQLNSLKILNNTRCFLVLASNFINKYQELKKKHFILDYSDLINIANQLLTNNDAKDWVLYKLDGSVEHILVDEAQDTSKEQWQIIESLSQEFFAGLGINGKDRTLFVVGDEKQSIFSFQGADPKNFHYMHDYFTKLAEFEENKFITVKLDTCFRSSAPVLKLVDEIFKDPKLSSAITCANGDVLHKSFRYREAGKVCLWPLIKVINEEHNQPWILPIERKTKHDPASKLAEIIASNIKKWLDEKLILKSKNRPINEGDIMILVRRRNDFTDYLVRELKKNHIKVAGIDRMKITENIAIMDLMAMANFLLLQADDLSLASLLKSPLFSISEEKLMELAINRPGTLWDSLKLHAENDPYFLSSYQYLEELILLSKTLSPFALFNYMIEVKNGRSLLYARLGLEINDPLDEFINLTLMFEKDHIPSLQDFVKWFEQSNIEIKRDLENSHDQIRIMTIHASKGLQAPIVILADTVVMTNSPDKLLFDDLVIWPGKAANYNQYCQDLKYQKQISSYQEYLRLLYVALTRAEDELVICGYENNTKISDNCWYSIIRNTMQNIAEVRDFEIEDHLKEYLKNQECLVIEAPQLLEIASQDIAKKQIDIDLKIPEFLYHIAPKDQNHLKQITPSNIENKNISLFERQSQINFKKGNIIHKLLEYSSLVGNNVANIRSFVSKYASGLDKEIQNTILEQYLSLIQKKEYEIIFSKEVKTEVSISGVIDEKFLVSGKIDRLVISENQVIIVDYKSDTIPAKDKSQVDQSYIRQMSLYRALLKQIHPDKQIYCWLIYTSNASIIEI